VALLLSSDGRVRTDDDLVFYNAPSAENGAVRVLGRRAGNGRTAEGLEVALPALPGEVNSIVVAATMSDARFGDLTNLQLSISAAGSDTPAASVDLSGSGAERAYVAAESYKRGDLWKVRAVGQGWDGGLVGLATEYGVTIDHDSASTRSHGPRNPPDAGITRRRRRLRRVRPKTDLRRQGCHPGQAIQEHGRGKRGARSLWNHAGGVQGNPRHHLGIRTGGGSVSTNRCRPTSNETPGHVARGEAVRFGRRHPYRRRAPPGRRTRHHPKRGSGSARPDRPAPSRSCCECRWPAEPVCARRGTSR
jgi:stress response protein SCP2